MTSTTTKTRPGVTHGADFAAVSWYGTLYTFTKKQRIIVASLWAAWEAGYHWLTQERLLEDAESDCSRLRDLFRGHPAWGTMIVSKSGGEIYRLAPEFPVEGTVTP